MKTIVLVSAILLSQSLFAAGPSVGGGGDIIVLPDDSVVIADPFLDHGKQQPGMDMPPQRSLNPRVLKTVRNYAQAAEDVLNQLSDGSREITKIMEDLATRGSDLVFYGVKTEQELNMFCASGGRKTYKLPSGGFVQQVACTAGNETFIVEPLFARMSLRDQGLILIHERLTTLRDAHGNKNYSAIARFTTGLNIFLNLYREQSMNKFRDLNTQERSALTEFYVATQEIVFRNKEVDDDSFEYVAHVRGGGAVHSRSVVDPTATIPVQTILGAGNRIGANSFISAANVYVSNVIADENVRATGLSLGANANLVIGKDSIVNRVTVGSGEVELGQKVRVESSQFVAGHVSVGDNVGITNSAFGVSGVTSATSIGDHSKIENSHLVGGLKFAAKTQISDSELLFDSLTVNGPITLRSVNAREQRQDSYYRPTNFITGDIVLAGHNQVIENKVITNESLTALPRGQVVNFPPAKDQWVQLSVKDEFAKYYKDQIAFVPYNIFAGEGGAISVTQQKSKQSCFIKTCKIEVQGVNLRIAFQTVGFSGNELTVDEAGLLVPAGLKGTYSFNYMLGESYGVGGLRSKVYRGLANTIEESLKAMKVRYKWQNGILIVYLR